MYSTVFSTRFTFAFLVNVTTCSVESLAFSSVAVSDSFFTYEITRLAVVFKSASVKPPGHFNSGLPFGSTGVSFSCGEVDGTSTILGLTTILNI